MRPTRKFYFRLARELGYPHPDYLLDELTSQQITEWLAYNEIEPIGDWVHELRFARLMALITNIFTKIFGKKGNTKQAKPNDFMPPWYQDIEKPKQQSLEEQKNILYMLAGLKDKKSKKE